MANTKSAKKAVKKSKQNRKSNISNKSMLRTFIKKVNKEIENKNKSQAEHAFIIMQQCIDKHIAKKLIHKNRAARYKSNIIKRINSMTS